MPIPVCIVAVKRLKASWAREGRSSLAIGDRNIYIGAFKAINQCLEILETQFQRDREHARKYPLPPAHTDPKQLVRAISRALSRLRQHKGEARRILEEALKK